MCSVNNKNLPASGCTDGSCQRGPLKFVHRAFTIGTPCVTDGDMLWHILTCLKQLTLIAKLGD